jgi:hypothetical protein
MGILLTYGAGVAGLTVALCLAGGCKRSSSNTGTAEVNPKAAASSPSPPSASDRQASDATAPRIQREYTMQSTVVGPFLHNSDLEDRNINFRRQFSDDASHVAYALPIGGKVALVVDEKLVSNNSTEFKIFIFGHAAAKWRTLP